MIRIKLSNEERNELIKLREGSISENSEKALMVLLSSQGYSPIEISKIVKRNPHTVRLWLKRYKNFGIEGLQRKYSKGRPPDIREKSMEVISMIIGDKPIFYGFKSNSWTAQMIVDFLKREKIEVSVDTVRRALKRLGYSFKRPSKSVPRNAPSRSEKLKQIEKMISEIKSIIEREDCEIFCLDETHFSLDPYLSRGWIKIGEKKTSIAEKTRKKNNIWCVKYQNKTYILEEQ